MPAFFLSLLVCALVTLAGRESLRVARLAQARRASGGIVAAGTLASILSSGFAAWLGTALAPMLTAEAKMVFVAMALAFAALEVAVLRARAAPREPTRSLGATFLALLAAQVTDAARFVIMALAIMTAQPVLAALGGASGSVAALVLAAMAAGAWERHVPLGALRYAVAAALLLAAIMIGLWARGILF